MKEGIDVRRMISDVHGYLTKCYKKAIRKEIFHEQQRRLKFKKKRYILVVGKYYQMPCLSELKEIPAQNSRIKVPGSNPG